MSDIERQSLVKQVTGSIGNLRVTALLGARQCGKTTLARTFEVPRENHFDLEDPLDQAPSGLSGRAVVSSA